MKYIIAVDIGGTTFNSCLLSESFDLIKVSSKDKIRYHTSRKNVINALFKQIDGLIESNKVKKSDIIGIGIASPGPLDSKKGIILNTPNLKIFHNYKIAREFKKNLHLDTFIENDANLFALGEWYSQYSRKKIIMGVTLGTGLGLGLVINGKVFTGGNGLAMEYGLSPFPWGPCEKNVSISFIRNRAKELYGKEISPRIIEDYYNNDDDKAIQIYNDYGKNLGIVLSHVINMIDPEVISFGGGLSKAFPCFKNAMISNLKKYAPSFSINNIVLAQSKLRGKATMIGAAMMVKSIKR